MNITGSKRRRPEEKDEEVEKEEDGEETEDEQEEQPHPPDCCVPCIGTPPPLLGNTLLPQLFGENFTIDMRDMQISELVTIVESHFDVDTFKDSFLSQQLGYTPYPIDWPSCVNLIRPSTFYKDLRNANFRNNTKVIQIGNEEDRVFTLKEFPYELFVRDAYWELYYLMELYYHYTKAPKVLIVIGIEGIGKTRFSFFYMWLAAKLGKIFIHLTHRDYGTLYGPGFSFANTCMVMLKFVEDNVKNSKVDYIFVDISELSEPANGALLTIGRKVVYFVPPDKVRYRAVMKDLNARMFDLKLPTVEEMQEMYDQVNLFQQIMSLHTFNECLESFGPIPRYVFDYSDRRDSLKKDLERKKREEEIVRNIDIERWPNLCIQVLSNSIIRLG